MRLYLSQLGALVWKDLLIEARLRERLIAMAAFAVLIGILFNYALDRTAVRPQDIAAGLIWLTIVFGGLLGIGRSFHVEREEDALTGILLAPLPRDALYLAKVLANFILLSAVVLLIFGVFGLFFALDFGRSPLALVAVMLLGVLGFVAIGTLFSAVADGTGMGETLLPILVFPLLVPMVIYGVAATATLFAGLPPSEVAGSLRMLGAFTLIALAGGTMLFRFIVED